MRRKEVTASYTHDRKNAACMMSMSVALILTSTLMNLNLTSVYADENVDLSTNVNNSYVASVEATNDLTKAKNIALLEIENLYKRALDSLNLQIQVDDMPVDKARKLIINEYSKLKEEINHANEVSFVNDTVKDAKTKLDAKRAINLIIQESLITEIVPTLDPDLLKTRESAIIAIHNKAKEVDMFINDNNGKYLSQTQWFFYHDEVSRLTDDHPGSVIYKISVSNSKDEINSLKAEVLGQLDSLKHRIEIRIKIIEPIFIRLNTIYGQYFDEINTLPYLDKEEAVLIKKLIDGEKKNTFASIINLDDQNIADAEFKIGEFEEKLKAIMQPYRELNLMRQPYINKLTIGKEVKEKALLSFKNNPRYLVDFAESDIRSVYSSAYIDIAHAQNANEAENILVAALEKFEKIYQNIIKRKIRIEELEKLYKVIYRDVNGMKWLVSKDAILADLERKMKLAFDEIDEITDADEVSEVIDTHTSTINNILEDATSENRIFSDNVSEVLDSADESKRILGDLEGIDQDTKESYNRLIDNVIEPLSSNDIPEDLREILEVIPVEISEIIQDAQEKSKAIVELKKSSDSAEEKIENLDNLSKPIKLKTKSKIRRNFNKAKKDILELQADDPADEVTDATKQIDAIVNEAIDNDAKLKQAKIKINNTVNDARHKLNQFNKLSSNERKELDSKLTYAQDDIVTAFNNIEEISDIYLIGENNNAKVNSVINEASILNTEKENIIDDLKDCVVFSKDIIETLDNISDSEKKDYTDRIQAEASKVISKSSIESKDLLETDAQKAKAIINEILERANELNNVDDERSDITHPDTDMPLITDPKVEEEGYLPVIKDEVNNDTSAETEVKDTEANKEVVSKENESDNDPQLTVDNKTCIENKPESEIETFQNDINREDANDDTYKVIESDSLITNETTASININKNKPKRLPKTSDTYKNQEKGLFILSLSLIAFICSKSSKRIN